MRKAFEPTAGVSSHLNVQLVVLAVPLSNRLAQVFLSLGVQHVVTFGYDTIVKTQPTLIPLIQNMIYIFCLDFYGNLLRGNMEVQRAFNDTVNQNFEKEYSAILKIFAEMELAAGRELNEDLILEGPRLWPMNEVNNQPLFS